MSDLLAQRIQRLDHRDAAVAQGIHAVLQRAYAQEAALLGLRDFAPLQRRAADIQGDGDLYLGAIEQGQLCGALAFAPDDEPGQFIVNALVVDPAQQRRGYGRALMLAALQLGGGHPFAVSTAAANGPALALYRGLGFVEYRRGTLGEQGLAMVKLRRMSGP